MGSFAAVDFGHRNVHSNQATVSWKPPGHKMCLLVDEYPMASDMNAQGSFPHLDSEEAKLLSLVDDDRRDAVALSDKEALVLKLYGLIQEQKLERAFLDQDQDELFGDDAKEQLAITERELLEARAKYTVKTKAVASILMTDPTLKAVHFKANTPPERALFSLVNIRDVFSLALENLAAARNSTLQELSDLEIENLRINRRNQQLARELLDLTREDVSWRNNVPDGKLKGQLGQLEADERKAKAKWETIKNVASAVVVGSGVNWADDELLTSLVLDEDFGAL